ncbi:MAG: ZIP family metal transporter [Acidobacteriota bacterium]
MGTALIVIIYGLTAAAANLLGGFFVSSRRLGQTTLRYLIALGAGFMLAAVFLKIVPETIAIWEGQAAQPMIFLMVGYLLIQLFEHTIAPHFHFGEEVHHDAMLEHHAALAGVAALMIHAFFDGVSIAAAALVNTQLGVLIFIAILLHKLPEGFTVASMMLASKRSSRSALMAALSIGIATFAGVALVLLFHQVAVYSHPLSSYFLPLSAGVTLYVAASDLIPEVNKEEGATTSLIVFAGVAMLYLVELLLEAFHLNH